MNNYDEMLKQVKAWGFTLDPMKNEYVKEVTRTYNIGGVKKSYTLGTIRFDYSSGRLSTVALWEQHANAVLCITSLDSIYWEMRNYEDKLNEILLHYEE